jgi:hypothetical protein
MAISNMSIRPTTCQPSINYVKQFLTMFSTFYTLAREISMQMKEIYHLCNVNPLKNWLVGQRKVFYFKSNLAHG